MTSKQTVQLTDATFTAEVERYEGLAMIDFGADWCAPCRIIAPIVEQLALTYAGRVKVGAVDVDANPEVSMRYDIRSLPTILFFRDGVFIERVVGAVPRAVLERRLTELLTPTPLP